jgi:hypothetical protein
MAVSAPLLLTPFAEHTLATSTLHAQEPVLLSPHRYLLLPTGTRPTPPSLPRECPFTTAPCLSLLAVVLAIVLHRTLGGGVSRTFTPS